MYKTILVALDGSEFAESIICQAEELAKLTGAQISLLRVALVNPFPGADNSELERKAVERCEAYLDGLAGDLRKKGFTVSTHVRYGHAPTEILEHAAKYADLLVMTTHGRSGIGRWAMGSVASQVIRHCRIPVLIFRADESCLASPDIS
jgi:nucleotide-binding universal stress UspA family protein